MCLGNCASFVYPKYNDIVSALVSFKLVSADWPQLCSLNCDAPSQDKILTKSKEKVT